VEADHKTVTVQRAIGVTAAVGSYLWWGFIPVFFKLLAHLPPVLVLGHRIVWTFATFAVLVFAGGGVREIAGALRSRRATVTLLASALLLAINWGVFIWAVTIGKVLQSSLGYFIVPLVSVALGVMFLRERLRRWQLVALVLAGAGVIVLTAARGELPWIALLLALSFGFYGLLRKTVRVDSIPGLCIETAMLTPAALVIIAAGAQRGMHLVPARHDLLLLMLAGPVTALPLLLFSIGARRLRLSTMGFLQYLVPTCQFAVAVRLYHEPFGAANAAGFALIWTALAVYSADSLVAYRGGAAAGAPAIDPDFATSRPSA
jgi:chloramphenicol-sensitive protein RarD